MANKKEQEVIEAMKDILVEKHPYILQIINSVKSTENGMVNLQLRVYNGFVTDVITTETKRHTFKPPKK